VIWSVIGYNTTTSPQQIEIQTPLVWSIVADVLWTCCRFLSYSLLYNKSTINLQQIVQVEVGLIGHFDIVTVSDYERVRASASECKRMRARFVQRSLQRMCRSGPQSTTVKCSYSISHEKRWKSGSFCVGTNVSRGRYFLGDFPTHIGGNSPCRLFPAESHSIISAILWSTLHTRCFYHQTHLLRSEIIYGVNLISCVSVSH